MVIKPPSTPLLHLRHAREAFHFVARTLEATDESRYRRVLRRIERICNRLRKYCLIFTTSTEKAREYLDHGFDGVAHNTDFTVFTEAFRSVVSEIRG